MITWTMKAFIFHHIWLPFMHLGTISDEMHNKKHLDLHVIECNKTNNVQIRHLFFYGEIVQDHDNIALKNAYLFIYMLKINENNFYKLQTNRYTYKKYKINTKENTYKYK